MKPPLRPLPLPIHDCAYGALITFDCAYGAFITLGANATTCRRQSIIYKYPSISPYLRLFIVGAAEGGERRQTNRRRRLVENVMTILNPYLRPFLRPPIGLRAFRLYKTSGNLQGKEAALTHTNGHTGRASTVL